LVLYYDRQPLPLAGGSKEARLQRLCLLRDRAILHTLYATAGRVSEVAALTRQDVAEGETDEVLITGKGDKERWLYLTPEALAAIRAYLSERADFKTGLFISHGRDSGKKLSRTSLWRVVKKAAEAVGLPDVSPHTFRHWRASQMLNDEVPLEIIQELLGHSDIGTTRKVYAHSKRQRIKEAFQKHSPSPQQAMDNNQQDESLT
jgi:integrase/recombinase XerD